MGQVPQALNYVFDGPSVGEVEIFSPLLAQYGPGFDHSSYTFRYTYFVTIYLILING